MLIVGITGTAGAGKGTIVSYLVRRGFRHYSVRDYLTDIIRARGMPLNRDSMVVVANELRALHGPSHLVVQLYRRASESGGNCVIESIRAPGEVRALREAGRFTLIGVDAPLLTRYERVRLRSSATDQVSLERFRSDDEREMSSTDPNHQNIAACMALADHRLQNDGTIEALEEKVGKIIEGIRDP